MKAEFLVENDNILGVAWPDRKNQMAILSSSVIRGASCDRLGGVYPLSVTGKGVRLATREDFETFRVCSKGYEADPRYNFPKN